MAKSVNLPLPWWFTEEKLKAIHKTIRDRAWLRGYEQEAFQASKNQIYYNWGGELNIKEMSLDKSLPLILSPDWNIGDVEYMAWVVMQDTKEETRVIGEIPFDNVSVRVATRLFMSLYPPELPIKIYGDATGWSRDAALGSNCYNVMLQELESWNEGGIELFVHPYNDGNTRKLPRNPARIDRHNSVNDRLLDSGVRRLFVDPRCERTIECVTLLEYKEGTRKEADNESLLGHTWVQIGYFTSIEYPAERKYKMKLEPTEALDAFSEEVWKELSRWEGRNKHVSEYLGSEF